MPYLSHSGKHLREKEKRLDGNEHPSRERMALTKYKWHWSQYKKL